MFGSAVSRRDLLHWVAVAGVAGAAAILAGCDRGEREREDDAVGRTTGRLAPGNGVEDRDKSVGGSEKGNGDRDKGGKERDKGEKDRATGK